MKWARILLYAQVALTLTCGVLALLELKKQAEIGWRFSRWLEEFFGSPVVIGLYLACQLSCLAFPVSMIVLAGSSLGERSNDALIAVGRISAWRWALAVAASVALALLQFATLEIVYPVRE
jgi:hypothetical protein